MFGIQRAVAGRKNNGRTIPIGIVERAVISVFNSLERRPNRAARNAPALFLDQLAESARVPVADATEAHVDQVSADACGIDDAGQNGLIEAERVEFGADLDGYDFRVGRDANSCATAVRSGDRAGDVRAVVEERCATPITDLPVFDVSVAVLAKDARHE